MVWKVSRPHEQHMSNRHHSIFYFGYMLGTLIWSKIVQRFPGHIGKTISSAVMIWSIIILLTRESTLAGTH